MPYEVIDAHHHWIPARHMERLETLLKPGDSVRRKGDTVTILRGDEAINNMNRFTADVPTHLADMDAAGVRRAIFSLGIWLEFQDLVRAREINDALAEIQQQSGGRIVRLVHVPPLDDGAASELERGVKELGLHGANVTTHWLGIYVDQPAFRPFLRKAAELDVPILVHASSLSGQCAALDGDRTQLGRIVDQTLVAIRLMLSDVFEELPTLRIVLPQLGGSFFGIKSRLGLTADMPRTDDGWGQMGQTYLASRMSTLDHLWFDSGPGGQWGAGELRLAVANLGTDRVLFGSDYPSRRHWLQQGMDAWRGVELSDADRAKVMGGNAATVFKIR